MLFDWLLEQINDWLSPTEMDSTVGIVDIYGFEVATYAFKTVAVVPLLQVPNVTQLLPCFATSGSRREQLRAALHQLRKRAASALCHSGSHLPGAGWW